MNRMLRDPAGRFRLPTVVRLSIVATLAVTLAVAAMPRVVVAQGTISVNTGLTPTALTFGLKGIAWQLTPTANTTVGGIRTWFSDAGGSDRSVTFELRDGSDVNGAALRSVTFNSAVARTGLGGADFTPIDLTSGSNYWLVFLGIQGLGRNVQETPPPGSTLLPVRILPPNAAQFVAAPIASSAPVLQLTAVPEPSTGLLLATGVALLAWGARRRRRLALVRVSEL